MAHAAMAPSLLLANGHESAGIDKAKWLEATPPGEPHVACAAMRLHSVIQGQFEALEFRETIAAGNMLPPLK